MNRESADQDPLVGTFPSEIGRRVAAPGLPIELEKSVLTASCTPPSQGQTSPLISWKPLRGSIYRGYSIRGSFLVSRFIPVPSGPRRAPDSWQLSAYQDHAFSHYTWLRRFTMRHLYIREDNATSLHLRNTSIMIHTAHFIRKTSWKCPYDVQKTYRCLLDI